MTEPFIPQLWSDKLLQSLREELVLNAIEPRMVPLTKIQQLIESIEHVGELDDLASIMREVMWRRERNTAQQTKIKDLEAELQALKNAIKSNPRDSEYRVAMRGLKF